MLRKKKKKRGSTEIASTPRVKPPPQKKEEEKNFVWVVCVAAAFIHGLVASLLARPVRERAQQCTVRSSR